MRRGPCDFGLFFVMGLVLFFNPGTSWAIYGPSLTRADNATALRACEEGNFSNGESISAALQSEDPAKIAPVLGKALEEVQDTRVTSEVNAARRFCVHELVPAQLPSEEEMASREVRQPTALVKQYKNLGIEYFYYGPDADWTLEKNPVDLNLLAKDYLDLRWGREAFLMMTRLGWSQGACQEGPDQFREVINHSEPFLVDYPDTEVSNDVRLELANAYATWWNVSRMERKPPEQPEKYKVGANEAKQRAIELYQQYLKAQKEPDPEVEKRLKALQKNPEGSGKFDYFCEDYED